MRIFRSDGNCGFTICGPNIFLRLADGRFADPFFGGLETLTNPQLHNLFSKNIALK
jgi:hypothetical protein